MKHLLFLLLPVCLIVSAHSQTITISGPDETCPNEEVTYHVYAKDMFGLKMTGSISWGVYINGVYVEELSDPVMPCLAGGSKDFYITPFHYDNSGNPLEGWGQVGEVELRVRFMKGFFNPFCNTVMKTKYITSRVSDPGEPATSDGELTFCPGETKTVYLDPGLPEPYNSINNCFFHYNWLWSVPSGWTVNYTTNPGVGNDNHLSTSTESVKVTAPSIISPGASSYYITVEAESIFGEWMDPITRQIEVGLSGNIAGSSTVCTSNKTFTLQNIPSGVNVSWSKSGNLTYVSGQNTVSYTVKAASSSTSASGYVTANLSGYCGNQSVAKSFWIGKPVFNAGYITGPSTLYIGSSGLYTSPSANHYDYYQWTFPHGGLRVMSGQGMRSARLEPTGSTGLKIAELRAYNSCGYTYEYIYVDVESSSGGGGPDPCANTLVVSPNPTSGDMEAVVLPPVDPDPCPASMLASDSLAINPDSFSAGSMERDGSIVITNHIGDVVYDKKHRGKKINIPLHHLNPGIYVIQYMHNDEELLSAKFIKQ